jgi:surface antigen
MNPARLGGLAALPLLLIFALVFTTVTLTAYGGRSSTAPGCPDPQETSTATPENSGPNAPAAEIPGYSGEQLHNATVVIGTGQALRLNTKGIAIGVMTAMGESSLHNVAHGDAVGPDSRGLFQQRANGAWGSEADRMNAAVSSANFFKALQGVDGWEDLRPTIAAHRVQRNADPYHYEKYWPEALRLVSALLRLTGLQDCYGTGPRLTGPGDDLPWRNSVYCQLDTTCPAAAVSPLGMYSRECVDFALWRLNSMSSSTSSPWKLHNSLLGLGNAMDWEAGWQRHGWETGSEPRVGAIAFFSPGVAGAGKLGHVGVVSAISSDGRVTMEEYNGMPPPNDHRYGIRSIRAEEASSYLYFPEAFEP